MILDLPITNFTLGAWLADALAEFRGPSPSINITAMLAQQLPLTVTSQYSATRDDLPAWYFGQIGQYGLLAIEGVSTVTQSTKIFAGYNGDNVLLDPDISNDYYVASAQGILDAIAFLAFQNTRKLTLCGHSLGGALCQCIAREMKLRQWPQDIRVITFGSPRPGGARFNEPLTRIESCRWMDNEDPVPIVPPTVLDFLGLPVVVGVKAALRYQLFRHLHGGVKITAANGVQPAEIPDVSGVQWPTSFAAWVLGLDGVPLGPHGILTYQANLTKLSQQFQGANGGASTTAPAEPPADSDRQQVNAAERQVAQTIFIAADRQNAQPPEQPVNSQFMAVKLGRVWYVTLGGQVVALAGRKSRARRFARIGNAWLDTLQQQPIVDTDELGSQFAAYLQAAQTPDVGFVPVIQRQLQA